MLRTVAVAAVAEELIVAVVEEEDASQLLLPLTAPTRSLLHHCLFQPKNRVPGVLHQPAIAPMTLSQLLMGGARLRYLSLRLLLHQFQI
jgi:hypothetical protein